MNDLKQLYQDVIVDHNRSPRNFHDMPECTCQAQGFNPLCGDQVTVFLKLDNDMISDLSFIGSGCAICTASASLMTEYLKGKSCQTAEKTFQLFHDKLVDKEESSMAELGKLAILQGVREFPMRIKCATLAWHTMRAALNKQTAPVSTE